MTRLSDALHPTLRFSPAEIAAFCEKWGIVRLEIFGSALRWDFNRCSDVDFLYTLGEETNLSLWDVADLQDELSRIVGCETDLVSRKGIERSENRLRRKEILEHARVVYECQPA